MTADRYLGLTPAETLAQFPLLTFTQTAWVLQWLHVRGDHKGEPSRRMVVDAVERGELKVVNPDSSPTRQRVSSGWLRSYIEGTL
jgi:hypothetical protein